MSELDKTEALTKAGLMGVGIMLVTGGLETLREGDTRTGLILIGIGVVCIVIREAVKPFFEKRRNTS